MKTKMIAILIASSSVLMTISLKSQAQERDHSCLKISKKILTEHIDKKGKKIMLRGSLVNNNVVLTFYGFDENNELVHEEALEDIRDNCLKNVNAFFGDITTTIDGVPLHYLMASMDTSLVKDWYLKPEKFKSRNAGDTDRRKDKYVSYLLGNDPAVMKLPGQPADPRPSLKVAYYVTRVNPSPPAD